MLCFVPCHLSLNLCFFSCHCLSGKNSFLFDLYRCHLCSLEIFFISSLTCSKNSFSFARFFIDSLQRNIHNSLVSFFSHASPSSFAAIPMSIGALASFFLFLAVGTVADVLQRNEKLIVRHRRSTESEVQKALKHQFLDCEHLFLIPDCAVSVPRICSSR